MVGSTALDYLNIQSGHTSRLNGKTMSLWLKVRYNWNPNRGSSSYANNKSGEDDLKRELAKKRRKKAKAVAKNSNPVRLTTRGKPKRRKNGSTAKRRASNPWRRKVRAKW